MNLTENQPVFEMAWGVYCSTEVAKSQGKYAATIVLESRSSLEISRRFRRGDIVQADDKGGRLRLDELACGVEYMVCEDESPGGIVRITLETGKEWPVAFDRIKLVMSVDAVKKRLKSLLSAEESCTVHQTSDNLYVITEGRVYPDREAAEEAVRIMRALDVAGVSHS